MNKNFGYGVIAGVLGAIIGALINMRLNLVSDAGAWSSEVVALFSGLFGSAISLLVLHCKEHLEQKRIASFLGKAFLHESVMIANCFTQAGLHEYIQKLRTCQACEANIEEVHEICRVVNAMIAETIGHRKFGHFYECNKLNLYKISNPKLFNAILGYYQAVDYFLVKERAWSLPLNLSQACDKKISTEVYVEYINNVAGEYDSIGGFQKTLECALDAI